MIGTGSSGVQAIPLLAEEADRLTVFQRTPTYAAPARNAPLDPAVEAEVKADYEQFRARLQRRATAFGASYPRPAGSALEHAPDDRIRILEERWELGGFALSSAFNDTLLDTEANDIVADFIRDKIRDIVDDPETAELLCPDQTFACKRPCVDSGYYETFNRENVTLVSVRDNPIARLTRPGSSWPTDRPTPPTRSCSPRDSTR